MMRKVLLINMFNMIQLEEIAAPHLYLINIHDQFANFSVR